VSRVAVLFSGGLDSAVLLAHEARSAFAHPLYVSTGLAWEAQERPVAASLVATPPFAGRTAPLANLDFTVRDLYPASHWAVTGHPPAYDTPDEDVYLTGRNLVLITKGAIYCAQHGIERLVLGPLAGNPFPDARPEFLAAMARAASLGLDHPLDVVAPFSTLHKADVIRLGVELGVPLDRTLSCMNPGSGRRAQEPRTLRQDSAGDEGGVVHCGACSKCRERQDAFREAGVDDPTPYLVRRR
jgi:7-cyano-7-deazaguanine synthase